VAHLYDGRVAAFSWRDDLQGRMLDDAVSQRALQATQPLVQSIVLPETTDPGYDVAIPVFISGSPKKWGTIRVGFSLQRAYALIRQTRRALLMLSVGAVVCGTSLASFLAMRISKPIGQLVAGVQAFAKGTYSRPIAVEASDEIGYLADAFEQMRVSLQRHLEHLADEKRRLEEANRRLQETQQQLIQSERLAAVGQVAARVAHEVNNPLAIIKTAIGVINHRHRDHNPAAEHLQMIGEEINRIARIIDELREFSRPTPTYEVVHVNHIIQSLEGLLGANLRERQIVLKVILEPHLPYVCISADQLKQVILNMVRNAEDAMPQGGELVIRTARKGNHIEFSMTDTGCGISPEHRGRLFDPFYTTKGKERGMGLGLSVSYGIIQGANGRIDVESEVGKGSTFRVSLPVCGDRQEG
jgi:two-component system, NtrC family, sensor kinase